MDLFFRIYFLFQVCLYFSLQISSYDYKLIFIKTLLTPPKSSAERAIWSLAQISPASLRLPRPCTTRAWCEEIQKKAGTAIRPFLSIWRLVLPVSAIEKRMIIPQSRIHRRDFQNFLKMEKSNNYLKFTRICFTITLRHYGYIFAHMCNYGIPVCAHSDCDANRKAARNVQI